MKKAFSVIGIIVSLAVVLFGLLIICGAMGGDTNYASSSYLYDSGYAEFGADFYTYVSNNAAEAASASRTIASNLSSIAKLIKNASGIFLMGFGLMGFCFFGGFSSKKEATVPAEPATTYSAPIYSAPAATETVEETPTAES